MYIWNYFSREIGYYFKIQIDQTLVTKVLTWTRNSILFLWITFGVLISPDTLFILIKIGMVVVGLKISPLNILPDGCNLNPSSSIRTSLKFFKSFSLIHFHRMWKSKETLDQGPELVPEKLSCKHEIDNISNASRLTWHLFYENNFSETIF